jgi:hypothetical protein
MFTARPLLPTDKAARQTTRHIVAVTCNFSLTISTPKDAMDQSATKCTWTEADLLAGAACSIYQGHAGGRV